MSRWGCLWNLTMTRAQARDVVCISEMIVSSFPLCWSESDTRKPFGFLAIQTPCTFTRASISHTTPARLPPASSLGSHLPRYRGCPDLAGFPPQCRQRHRQPLGGVSSPVRRGWQAPGSHPPLKAAGTPEWWRWGGEAGRGSLYTDAYTM